MYAVCRRCEVHCTRRHLYIGVPLFAAVDVDWKPKVDHKTILFPHPPTLDEIRAAGIWEEDVFVVKINKVQK